MTRTYLLVSAMPLLMTGCIIDPQHVEKDFGNSVRQMVAAQIIDPEMASNPDLLAPDVLDGVGGETSIEEYREDFKRKKKEAERLTISVN